MEDPPAIGLGRVTVDRAVADCQAAGSPVLTSVTMNCTASIVRRISAESAVRDSQPAAVVDPTAAPVGRITADRAAGDGQRLATTDRPARTAGLPARQRQARNRNCAL